MADGFRIDLRKLGAKLPDGVQRAGRKLGKGAREYGVTLTVSNGERVFRLTRKRRIRLTGVNPLARGSVSVRALSATGERGAAAERKLARR